MTTSRATSPQSPRTEDTPMEDAPLPPPPVESLVAGRSRRANAGNLLSKLLHQELEEDEIFLEDDEDYEFKLQAKDDLGDVELSSSSSEDEAEVADEDAGERELQRQEKEELKAKKRKANEMFLKPKRAPAPPKKVTIVEDATETESPGPIGSEAEATATDTAARPRKRSERTSWVPEFVATRASNRSLSLQNRTQTLQRLEESEKRRLKVLADMEKAAARKKKANPVKEMTQEERLAEAKITERRNRKSLNTWENLEKAKQEEQRKKLAELQNRRLAGPVITYWSGTAGWNKDGELIKLGKSLIEELEDEDMKRRRKMRQKAAKERAEREAAAAAAAKKKEEDAAKPAGPPTTENYTIKSSETPVPDANGDSNSTPEAVRSTTPSDSPPHSPRLALNRNVGPTTDSSGDEIKDVIVVANPSNDARENTEATGEDGEGAAVKKEPEPELEISARNLIVLANFEHEQIHDRKSLVKTLWGPQVKQQPTQRRICAITNQPARFLDPATGMPYASLHAYREIRRILDGDIQWSCLLGAYVGEKGSAAQGVPEGF